MDWNVISEWIQSGMKETAETVASYFLTAIRF